MTTVYPRACGGTASWLPDWRRRGGLSPRVRGNPTCRAIWKTRSRSIPARAGEPHLRHRRGRGAQVYPRACGGTRTIYSRPGAWTGLSPRVRGNPGFPLHDAGIDGSIPARAGEPDAESGTRTVLTVYPRACGGTGYSVATWVWAHGLSPRVRGNPLRANV